MFWLKLRQCKGSILIQFVNSCRQIWQVYKIIAEDINCPWEFWKSAPVFFKCLQKIYKMRTIRNPQDGIRVKTVLNLTNKLKMVEIKTDSDAL